MRLFRLAKSAHINDTAGEGARLYGGRWNDKGVPVIYTSESLSLAALEYLAHVPLVLVPDDLNYRWFDVPDDARISEIRISQLPPDWHTSPPLDATAELGTAWTRGGKTLLFKVPSVMVPGEYNFLINPAHPHFAKVKPGRPRPFEFDRRLLKGE